MTEPHERTRALLKTRYFLEQLTRPDDTPGVPDDMRATAQQLLKHFLTDDDIDEMHDAAPDVLSSVVQRQPLGESAHRAARKERYLPFAPIHPRFRKSEVTQEDEAQYRAEVEAWKQRSKS